MEGSWRNKSQDFFLPLLCLPTHLLITRINLSLPLPLPPSSLLPLSLSHSFLLDVIYSLLQSRPAHMLFVLYPSHKYTCLHALSHMLAHAHTRSHTLTHAHTHHPSVSCHPEQAQITLEIQTMSNIEVRHPLKWNSTTLKRRVQIF